MFADKEKFTPQVLVKDSINVGLLIEKSLNSIEKNIRILGSLVADNGMEDRFCEAVEKFKKTISESSEIPQFLKHQFTSLDYQWGSNQQAYVEKLKQQLNWCRTDFNNGRISGELVRDSMEILNAKKINGSRDTLPKEKAYTIDEDGVIHRDPKAKLDKNAIASAMEVLRNIQTEPENKVEKSDDNNFWDLVAGFKNRNGGKK